MSDDTTTTTPGGTARTTNDGSGGTAVDLSTIDVHARGDDALGDDDQRSLLDYANDAGA